MIVMLTCQQLFINGAMLFFVIIFVGMFFCPFPQSALYEKGQKNMPTKIIIKHTSYYNLRNRGLGAKSVWFFYDSILRGIKRFQSRRVYAF